MDGRSATVELSCYWAPPVLTLFVPKGFRIDVTSIARSVSLVTAQFVDRAGYRGARSTKAAGLNGEARDSLSLAHGLRLARPADPAHAEFGRRLEAVTDWHADTPDTEWDVSDLARHVIREQQWVPPLLDGKTIEEVGDDIDAIDETTCSASGRSGRRSRPTPGSAHHSTKP